MLKKNAGTVLMEQTTSLFSSAPCSTFPQRSMRCTRRPTNRIKAFPQYKYTVSEYGSQPPWLTGPDNGLLLFFNHCSFPYPPSGATFFSCHCISLQPRSQNSSLHEHPPKKPNTAILQESKLACWYQQVKMNMEGSLQCCKGPLVYGIWRMQQNITSNHISQEDRIL